MGKKRPVHYNGKLPPLPAEAVQALIDAGRQQKAIGPAKAVASSVNQLRQFQQAKHGNAASSFNVNEETVKNFWNGLCDEDIKSQSVPQTIGDEDTNSETSADELQIAE
ncbi:Hypothetical predicted protein [Olea europaea subsp. europaea]|uniref:Uncharacterized protein n=1 Tax=Olea europaea subsp. europaea TaxID=158383 RepID=A0A8S0VL14_OLEEU|nr:Hypothetical predicted protein [Olea europaea subsp. europaea]